MDDGLNGRRLREAGALGLVVLAGLVAAALFVMLAGKDPLATFRVMLGYALGSGNGFAEVVVRAVPLCLAGLGVAVAFRCNVFNIGADGQIVVGAILAAAAVMAVPGLPGPLALAVFLACGIAGGAIYGGIAGWLRARFGVSEIIVTIMQNYIAIQFLTWMVRGPMQEAMGMFPRSDRLPDGAMLGLMVDGTRVHWGLALALAATLIVHVAMRHSSFGFQVGVVGRNPLVARFAGIADRRVVVLAMLASGGLAGLAGAVEIAGLHHRLQDDFAPGFGLLAIAVALLARLEPLAVPFSALLFGVLHVGSGAVQREIGLPFPVVWIFEAIVIFGCLGLGAVRARTVRAAA